MKKFITNILSGSDDVSHKRMIAIGSWVVLVAMVVVYTIGYQVNDTLIYVFAGMAGGQSVLTVIDKFIRK